MAKLSFISLVLEKSLKIYLFWEFIEMSTLWGVSKAYLSYRSLHFIQLLVIVFNIRSEVQKWIHSSKAIESMIFCHIIDKQMTKNIPKKGSKTKSKTSLKMWPKKEPKVRQNRNKWMDGRLRLKVKTKLKIKVKRNPRLQKIRRIQRLIRFQKENNWLLIHFSLKNSF